MIIPLYLSYLSYNSPLRLPNMPKGVLGPFRPPKGLRPPSNTFPSAVPAVFLPLPVYFSVRGSDCFPAVTRLTQRGCIPPNFPFGIIQRKKDVNIYLFFLPNFVHYINLSVIVHLSLISSHSFLAVLLLIPFFIICAVLLPKPPLFSSFELFIN